MLKCSQSHMQLNFYADENVPIAVSKGLKRRGINILTVQEVKLLSKNDWEQLKYASQQQRVIITHDSDFLTLIRKEKIEHQGILFFTRQVGIGEAVEEIERIWLTYSAEDLQGAVLFLPMRT